MVHISPTDVGLGALFVVLAIGVALAGLLLVRRRVPAHQLKEQHDVIGVSFAVIGGFYGVLLAFVLVASWERFERARDDTEAEANAVADLYRQSSGIPDGKGEALRGALVSYVRSVAQDEWPAMSEGRLSPAAQQLALEISSAVLDEEPQTPKDVALFQCMVQRVSDFGEARRYRLLYMQTGLPRVIWFFLIAFGVVTVAWTYFFGMSRLLPHAVITIVLAATIAWTLFIIWEMQTPFSGIVVVPDRAFRVILPIMTRTDPAGAAVLN